MPIYRIGQVNIHALTKANVIEQCRSWLLTPGEQGRCIVTPYSEFIVNAEKDEKFRRALNTADLSVPDGSGIIWSGHFIYRTKRGPFALGKSLLQLALSPARVYSVFPEKISGADVVNDLLELCEDLGVRVFFVGGSESTRHGLQKYIARHHPGLVYGGHYTGEVNKQTASAIRAQIQDAEPAVLITALSPPYQEIWLSENLPKLPSVKLGVGLGGTLDYLAGTKVRAPLGWRNRGLEWLWRLIHEPRRLPRMYRATSVFIRCIMREGRREVRSRKTEVRSLKKENQEARIKNQEKI